MLRFLSLVGLAGTSVEAGSVGTSPHWRVTQKFLAGKFQPLLCCPMASAAKKSQDDQDVVKLLEN